MKLHSAALLATMLVVACSQSEEPKKVEPAALKDLTTSLDATKRVSSDPDTELVDTVTSQRVREALAADATTRGNAASIQVTTMQGVVTMRGAVDSAAIKDRARVVANSTGNVRSVVNELVVDPNAKKETDPVETSVDRLTSDRVRQTLYDDKTTAAEAGKLHIYTREGVVRLRGAVSSDAVKQRMRIVAAAVGGVSKIDDQITVAGK
jgi:osmotically-inducible protein OsmY